MILGNTIADLLKSMEPRFVSQAPHRLSAAIAHGSPWRKDRNQATPLCGSRSSSVIQLALVFPSSRLTHGSKNRLGRLEPKWHIVSTPV